MSISALPLAGGWTIWKWLVLRGTGFPVDGVLALAMPELVGALDALRDRELALAQACERAAEALHALTRTAPADGKRLGKAIKRLKSSQLPETFDGYEPHLVEARQAAASHAHAVVAVDEAWQRARLRSSEVLRQVAAEPRFREAVLWQSRGALRGSIDALLRQPPGASDDKTRQQEQLVAGYLQRYCTKNDTIGFFGPMGFATIAAGAGALRCEPGRALVDRRQVFFEYWPIDALAETLSTDEALRPHLRPRRLPTVRVDGNVVHYPVARTAELPDEFARALALADGTRTARQLAATLLDEGFELDGEEEAFDLLSQLEAKRLLRWTLEVPTHTQRPERALRALLDEIADEPARANALAALDELEAARAKVASAAGDANALDVALGEADQTFTRLAGKPATRKSGEARTLMTEDCRRDLLLELRPRLVEELAPPLELLLTSARWQTHQMAERYSTALSEVYRRLRRDRPEVDLLQLWEQASSLFSDDVRKPNELLLEIRREMQSRWMQLLVPDPSLHRVTHRARELAPRVADAFASPRPGWPNARYHAPDLFVAAESIEAIERGEYSFVVGEIHAAINTVSMPVFLELHPAPDELRQATEREVPMRVEPVKLRETMHRRCWYSAFPADVDVETSTAPSLRPADHRLRLADLVAIERDGQLEVRSLDGRFAASAMEFFGFNLTQTLGELHFLPALDHMPRVSIDRLVIARERWRFRPDELAFARAETPLERLKQARRWQEKHGIPRFVFVKIPEETKPCYVDFTAPIYLEALARLVRKASLVTVTEMLPGPDQCWLPDADGQRYACELRFAVVDPQPWRR